MTISEIEEFILFNEPSFNYGGEEYSICCPDGRYYVTASDSPADTDLAFNSIDELLDGWIIQGKPFRDIVETIVRG